MRCVLDWGHQNGMVRPVLLLHHHRKVRSKEESIMAHRNLPRPAAVYGIDIGKNRNWIEQHSTLDTWSQLT